MSITVDVSGYEAMPSVQALRRYAEDRRPVGHFLTAVLSNDLTATIGRADESHMFNLRRIFQFVYNRLPRNCWGSPDRVSDWLAGEED